MGRRAVRFRRARTRPEAASCPAGFQSSGEFARADFLVGDAGSRPKRRGFRALTPMALAGVRAPVALEQIALNKDVVAIVFTSAEERRRLFFGGTSALANNSRQWVFSRSGISLEKRALPCLLPYTSKDYRDLGPHAFVTHSDLAGQQCRSISIAKGAFPRPYCAAQHEREVAINSRRSSSFGYRAQRGRFCPLVPAFCRRRGDRRSPLSARCSSAGLTRLARVCRTWPRRPPPLRLAKRTSLRLRLWL